MVLALASAVAEQICGGVTMLHNTSCGGGGDVTTATQSSATSEGCCQFFTDALRAFAWVAIEKKCYMKTGDGLPPPDWGKRGTAGDVCGWLPPVTAPTPAPQSSCQIFTDTDIDPHTPGLGNIVANNISTCCDACLSAKWAAKGCRYFTLSKGNCWFKATADVQVVAPGKTSGSIANAPSPVPTPPPTPPTPVPPTPSPTPAVALQDLFHQLDELLPRGDYRIPSLVATSNGTLLAFVMGRMHRTDATPNIVYLRRSHDDGATWEKAVPVLNDPTNRTMYGGAPVIDPVTGAVHFVHNAANWGARDCSACILKVISSYDNGATWSAPRGLNLSSGQARNATWGGGLASGIALTRGPHAGRLVVALRSDCGCGQLRASFVVYSDDNGATWTGGAPMLLLPAFGGGWTECEVAELRNGSVLMTSRNFYGASSGQGARLMARSDDGGSTWAANWTARDLPDPYCEGSILSNAAAGSVLFANPSSHVRANFSLHQSFDDGSTWPVHHIVYGGGSAYSDIAFTRNGSVAVLFEKDNYNTVAFGVVPMPLGA